MLEVSQIEKSYRKKKVLKGVELSVLAGECVGIIGANGCGKSTLLSILAGVTVPDGGTIKFQEQDLCKNPALFRRYIGYVPQNNPVIEELTVYDNLRLWYAAGKRNLETDLKEGIPARFSLDEVRRVRVDKLSGGMKKRLSIACAMAADTSVLVLDEPGAALDFPTKQDIGEYLKEFCGGGGAVILTSHEEAELAFCTRILALVGGKLVPVESNMSRKEWVAAYYNKDMTV